MFFLKIPLKNSGRFQNIFLKTFRRPISDFQNIILSQLAAGLINSALLKNGIMVILIFTPSKGMKIISALSRISRNSISLFIKMKNRLLTLSIKERLTALIWQTPIIYQKSIYPIGSFRLNH